MSAETLTTIEVSMPGDAYTLFESGPRLAVHLAGRSESGGTGPCICGFDRFARDDDGHMLHGFSVGGGTTGPGVAHEACAQCEALATDAHITGLHSGLFTQVGAS